MFAELPPYVLALIAGFLFAFGSQMQNLGVHQMPSRAGTMLTIGASAALYWMAAPVMLELSYFLHPAALIFAGLGLILASALSQPRRRCNQAPGPTLSSTLSATSPLFGAAFGILILGEMLTWQVAIGTLGIILSVLMLTRRNKKVPETWPLWALALPVGAAAIRAFGHGLSKIGMVYIPDPYFAGLLGFSVSFLLTSGLHMIKGRERIRINYRIAAPYWFMAAGACFGTAILSLNSALLQGDIITVVPIVAAAPVFSMLLSIFVFRKELLTLRIVAAVFVVMPSVVLIALGH